MLAATCWGRQPVPHPHETRAQQAQRPRESDIWAEMVHRIGSPPPERRWVHVADRGADCFSFLSATVATHCGVVVRIVPNQRVDEPIGGYLCDMLRAAPARAQRPLAVPGRDGTSARQTTVAISWQVTTVLPPQTRIRRVPPPTPIPIWAVRVWEPDPPPDVQPLEWLLTTTMPVTRVEEAWERVEWYKTRWTIEDFHQGLKTGCGAERTQSRDRAALERRIAVRLPVAVRLLVLRALARDDGATPVERVADSVAMRVVAHQTDRPLATTVGEYLRQIAQLGGYQGRRGDGPPGWRTLWRGWLRVADVIERVRLAADLGIP